MGSSKIFWNTFVSPIIIIALDQEITSFILLFQKAQLAICDLTITHQRREVVDFSTPFMTLGNISLVIIVSFSLTYH